MLGQYHAEGGITDGRYALYNSNAERVEQVLAQIKVGRGSKSCTVTLMTWGYYGTFHARITPLTLMFSLVPIPCR